MKKAAKKPAQKPKKAAAKRTVNLRSKQSGPVKPTRKAASDADRNGKQSGPVKRARKVASEQGPKQETTPAEPKRDTRFQPGVSGNPGGRPKRKPITDAYRAALEAVHPDDPEGRTFVEVIAERMVQAALFDRKAAKELADRIEGRPTQAVEMEHSGSIEVLNKLSDEEIDARLRALGVALGQGQTDRTAGAARGEGSPG